MSVNQLNGTIPSEIGRLSKLTNLYVNLNGMVIISLNCAGSCPSIGYLVLFLCLLAAWLDFRFCMNRLQYFTDVNCRLLYTNLLTGSIPSSIGSLTALTYLYEWLYDISALSEPSIDILVIINWVVLFLLRLETVASYLFCMYLLFGSVPELICRYMYQNQLTGSILSAISNCNKLVVLYDLLSYYIQDADICCSHLNDNKLSGSIPSYIGSLTALTYLYEWLYEMNALSEFSLGTLVSIS